MAYTQRRETLKLGNGILLKIFKHFETIENIHLKYPYCMCQFMYIIVGSLNYVIQT